MGITLCRKLATNDCDASSSSLCPLCALRGSSNHSGFRILCTSCGCTSCGFRILCCTSSSFRIICTSGCRCCPWHGALPSNCCHSALIVPAEDKSTLAVLFQTSALGTSLFVKSA